LKGCNVVRLLPPVLAVVLAAACSSTREPPLPSVPCAASEIAEAMDPAESVTVFVDEAVPAAVRADLESYLTRLWQTPTPVVVGAPEPGRESALWISSSEDARARFAPPEGGYALVRRDEGDQRLVVAAAASPQELAFAAYALLEELGIRFFHPMQELVPELEGPHLPRTLDARRSPMTRTRGVQFHLLHPLEYLRSLHEPGEENLAEARRLVDWLVKTGQNHLQWPILGSVPWEPFAAHAREVAAYAHARGVTVGAMVMLFEKASLQRGYVLVKDEAEYEAQIREGLDRLLEVPWDDLELALGEFFTSDPEGLVTWLDTAVAHVAARAPEARVSVPNHVGNEDDKWVDFRGERTFFYHVPKHADLRLGQSPHTIFWYDLYREGGMYHHPNFHLHREFIFEQLREHGGERRVRYFPESAYWIATDIDVPAFLPEFVESRWIDIHGLDRDIRAMGLAPLEGHIMFSSGHEWGYWMTDYLAAKMLWEPGAPLERFFSHYASAYGSCGGQVGADLARFVELQRVFLFEKKLVKYVSGEDVAIDLGSQAGFEIRELRPRFDVMVTGTEEERAAFEATDLADIETMARETKPIEDSIAARCRGSDAALAPWCDELRDGVRIVRLRLEHSALLYRAVIAHARGQAREAARLLAAGAAKTEEAKAVIETREKGYRFDLERLTGAYDNPTLYRFGYLRQAHTQCLWRRQDEQAKRIIEEGALFSTAGLPTCLD
jgi:hypothetical protein